jgi:hypothetical protein
MVSSFWAGSGRTAVVHMDAAPLCLRTLSSPTRIAACSCCLRSSSSRRLLRSFLAEALSAVGVVVSSCSSMFLKTEICLSCFFLDKALAGEAAALLFQ